MAGPEGAGVSWIVYAVIMLVFISVVILVLQSFGITSRYFGNMSIINSIVAAFLIILGIPMGLR
jgi:threonine/homoserine/homoserine lactone efflux protein